MTARTQWWRSSIDEKSGFQPSASGKNRSKLPLEGRPEPEAAEAGGDLRAQNLAAELVFGNEPAEGRQVGEADDQPEADPLLNRRPAGHLLVGRIASAHGLRGDVSIKVLSENENRFAAGTLLAVGPDPERSKTIQVEQCKLHSGRVLVRFSNVEDRAAAESLRGLLVFVSQDQVPQLGADTYWEHELVGATVVDVGGAELGRLAGIQERLEQDIWKVDTSSGPVLVPAAKDIVVSVELDARRIVVDPPKGLFPQAAAGGPKDVEA